MTFSDADLARFTAFIEKKTGATPEHIASFLRLDADGLLSVQACGYLIAWRESEAVSDPKRNARAYRSRNDMADGVTWQPIETAPRDGTQVLVWDPEDQDRVTAYWHAAIRDGRDRGGWMMVSGHNNEWQPEPTHWMPLPEPPAPDKQHDSTTPWREGMTWQEAMVEAHALAGKIPSQSVMDGAAVADRREVRVSRETFDTLVAIQMRSRADAAS